MLADTFHQLNHPGPKATAQKVNERYYWPNLMGEVQKRVRKCHDCQSIKPGAAIKPFMDNRPVGARFEDVQVDVVGPLPPSEGYTHLLTMVDRATNWLEAVPLREASARSCAEAFSLTWIASKGIPSRTTSDNGTTFTADLWRDLQAKYGIKVLFSPPYHASTVGSVERQH